MIKLLYIDLFCGAGGTSTGVENARHNGDKCAKVIACVNHDKNAIASHAENHPDTLHFTEDIRTLELSPLLAHIEKMKSLYPQAKVVLWASLECTNFSKAKGGKPRDADSRTLAECLFRYIETIHPDYIQIENVEEFMSWGDLCENGKPISRDAGRLYNKWVNTVKKYGYAFEYRILNSADFGAYTSRKRFFCTFAKDGLPIVFPQATHAKNPTNNDLFGSHLKKWKAVKDVLDFSNDGESIFTRKKPLVDKTLERIYAGLIKFVAGGKDKFLSKYFSGHPDSKNISVEEPAGAITTIDHHSLVQAEFLSAFYGGNPDRNYALGNPCPTVPTNNRFAKVKCEFLSAYYGNGHNHSTDKPSPVLTTKDRLSKVKCVFLDMQYGNGTPADCNLPAPALTVNPKHHLVTCETHYLMNPQYASAGSSIDNPCFTLIARMDKMPPYLIATESGKMAIEVYDTDSEPMRKIKQFMALYGIVDIKMRMLFIDELKQIMGFGKDYVLIGTKAEQKKYIGNAVEVTMARVMCEALVEALQSQKQQLKKVA